MNGKSVRYRLKKSLYYPAITLCSVLFMKLYFLLFPLHESGGSIGSDLTELAGLILMVGAMCIVLFTFVTFGVKLNSCISYGATRRQSLSVLFSSTSAGAVVLLLIFILFYSLGSSDSMSPRLIIMGLNLNLLSLLFAFPFGHLIMKYGKTAYYIITFTLLFAGMVASIAFDVHFSYVPGFDWTYISETPCGSILLSLGLAILLVAVWILLRRSTEKIEVKL